MTILDDIVSNKDKEALASCFSGVKGVVRTTGTQDGVVVKFKDFYLKIYDGTHGSAYMVQGFKYNDSTPMFTDYVKGNEMRQYATKFRTE